MTSRAEEVLARLKDPVPWTTMDGRVMTVRDMTDSHLRNSIRYIARKVQRHRPEYLGSPLGTLLSYNNAEKAIPSYMHSAIPTLIEEWQRRGHDLLALSLSSP